MGVKSDTVGIFYDRHQIEYDRFSRRWKKSAVFHLLQLSNNNYCMSAIIRDAAAADAAATYAAVSGLFVSTVAQTLFEALSSVVLSSVYELELIGL